MNIDIYKLCDKRLTKGSIRAVLDSGLKKKIRDAVSKVAKTKKKKEIARSLGISYYTLWDYLNRRESIPLIIIKKLDHLAEVNFRGSIKYLIAGQGIHAIRVPSEMNEDIAKLIGAIIADGHLRVRRVSRGRNYELIVREEYECNVLAFSEWFKNVFEIEVTPFRKKNHYTFYLSNKVVVYFFNKIMGILIGRKGSTVRIPPSITKMRQSVKIGVLQGIFMFDGGVNYTDATIALCSISRNLVKDTAQVLRDINLPEDYTKLQPDKLGRYWLVIRRIEKKKKAFVLFEEETEKWYRLREHFYGLNGPKIKDILLLVKELDKYYPRKRASAASFTDVISIVAILGNEAHVGNIAEKLKKTHSTTYCYLKKLTNWEILVRERRGLKMYWRLNGEFTTPGRQT